MRTSTVILKSIVVSIFSLLIACQSKQKGNEAVGINLSELQIKKRIPVSGDSDAKMVIENQIEFIKSFYIPSYDPYTGHQKINGQCQAENIFSKYFRNNKVQYKMGRIYLSPDGQYGGCSMERGSIKRTLIIFFCQNSNEVIVAHTSIEAYPIESQHVILADLCSP